MQDSVDWRMAQWQAERPDIDPSPMGIVARIQRANRLLERELRANFARHDMHMWEFDVLSTLRRSGPPFQLTPGQLLDATMVTSGAITNRVDHLVKRGLVTRESDPNNRRQVLITLTDQGKDLIDPIVTSHVNREDAILGGLTDSDRDQLAGLLRKLLFTLGDNAPPPRTPPQPAI